MFIEQLQDRTHYSITPAGLSPAQIRHVYGFDNVVFDTGGQSIVGDGKGQTIAIVDAFDAPNIASDLQTFDKQFGIKNRIGGGRLALKKVMPSGQPPVDAGWSLEISLDVEWAHAIAPRAKILLVEAASADTNDLLTAIDYARQQQGVVAVSMSWGGNESPFETFYDDYLTTPAWHVGGSHLYGGVTFVTSSGDNGPGTSWPAVSPNALAVGGSTLNVSSTGQYLSESAWIGSGGGISLYEPGVTHSPDVAYDADPKSGFAVFDSTKLTDGTVGWHNVGGTSAGAPQWAALVAIADEGRALQGLGSLDGPTQTINAIYNLPTTDFHAIPNPYPANAVNIVTGLGSPFADKVIADLLDV